MGLSWQQGPLGGASPGRFLTPEPLPERLLFAEPLRRRLRVKLAGEWIADSQDVLLLPEPGRYPVAYFPLIEYQRILRISTNIRKPSRKGLIRVPSRCAQRTGTSSILKPNLRARKRISGSKPKPSIVCFSKIERVRSR